MWNVKSWQHPPPFPETWAEPGPPASPVELAAVSLYPHQNPLKISAPLCQTGYPLPGNETANDIKLQICINFCANTTKLHTVDTASIQLCVELCRSCCYCLLFILRTAVNSQAKVIITMVYHHNHNCAHIITQHLLRNVPFNGWQSILYL